MDVGGQRHRNDTGRHRDESVAGTAQSRAQVIFTGSQGASESGLSADLMAIAIVCVGVCQAATGLDANNSEKKARMAGASAKVF